MCGYELGFCNFGTFSGAKNDDDMSISEFPSKTEITEQISDDKRANKESHRDTYESHLELETRLQRKILEKEFEHSEKYVKELEIKVHLENLERKRFQNIESQSGDADPSSSSTIEPKQKGKT